MAGNPQIKRPGAVDEYSPEMILELRKCQADAVYFIRNYVRVQHPTRGNVPFALFDFQEKYIRHLQDNRFVLTLQPRQSGKTITTAAYLLWVACFTEDATILIASKSQSHALEIAARIRFAYEELPNWLKPGVKYYNRHNLEMVNGSRILSEATTEKTGRGLSITKLYLDEMGFVNPRIQEELWASLAPTLSTGGSAIISSTPNGDTELFSQLWRGAKSGQNDFAPFEVHWREHPERGDEYWNSMVSQLGLLRTRQEVGCEFLSSDALLINSMKLQQIASTNHLYEDTGFKFWRNQEDIVGDKNTYLVSCDPSTGSGNDFSVIEVFHFPSLEQVAEYRSNDVNIPLLYAKIKWIVNKLSAQDAQGKRAEVVWTFERNGIGEAIAALYYNDEKQPEHAELYCDNPAKLGVYTTGKSKILACLNLKQLIEKTNNGLKINSDTLLFELKNFIAKGGSYEAKSGATDDAVMATVGIMRLLTHLSTWDDKAFATVNSYVEPDSTDEYGDEPIPFGIL